jgi:hypothetical protein
MKYEFASMYPKDNFDEILTVIAKPSWYNFNVEDFNYPGESTLTFVGSGSTWWDQKTDRRADGWLSSILHDMWNDELNKRLERKNCTRS